ncbi:hypothetical protein ACWCPT_12485 [Streptomyces sp. NPDC002308]
MLLAVVLTVLVYVVRADILRDRELVADRDAVFEFGSDREAWSRQAESRSAVLPRLRRTRFCATTGRRASAWLISTPPIRGQRRHEAAALGLPRRERDHHLLGNLLAQARRGPDEAAGSDAADALELPVFPDSGAGGKAWKRLLTLTAEAQAALQCRSGYNLDAPNEDAMVSIRYGRARSALGQLWPD